MHCAVCQGWKALFFAPYAAVKIRVAQHDQTRPAALEQITNEAKCMTLSKTDYLAIVRAHIQEAGIDHADLLRLREVRKLDRTIKAAERNDLGIDALCGGAGMGGGPITYNGLCYFFEDLIVSGIEKAISPLAWPDAGTAPTAAEIAAKIEDIDAKIDAMVTERDGFAAVLNSYDVAATEAKAQP
jgi:hypothetical protein